jgi:arylsulfatase A-like enzyme
MVGAKTAHWGAPSGDWKEKQDWIRDVTVSSAADVGFALGFGLVAFALLFALRRHPRASRVAGTTLVAVGALGALYAAASVQIFAFLRSPLTYPLLYLAGDMKSMRSSIGSFLSPAVCASLVLTPLAYAVAVWLSSRRPTDGRAWRWVPGTAALVALVWAVWGTTVADGRWSDRADLLIADCPHWQILCSLADHVRGGADVPEANETFARELLADFRPVQVARSVYPFAAKAARPRNVIQVVLESTGARYLSLYGSPYKTTPNLDAAAHHALVYDNFYAHAGFTANSLFAMTLSQHPYMTWREYTQEYPTFPGDTVPQLLKPLGYRSAFLTSSYLDYVCMGCFLKDRGFDEIHDWEVIGAGAPGNSWGGDESKLVDHTIEWIDKDRSKPFYLELWTQQTHHPYAPTAGIAEIDFFAGRALPPDDWDLNRYLNTLWQVDRQLGRLFAALEERGLDRDTVVIITGDHGEAFGDPHRTWGHGERVYQEGIRVPLMIWSPALFPQGQRVETIGGHVDLNPTVADLLHVPAPESWEGRSLFASERVPRTYFYAAQNDYLLGARQGTYKYIYNVTRGREELYDLAHDPDEHTNVADGHRELCRELRQRLAAWKSHASGRLDEARRQIAERVRLDLAEAERIALRN